MPPWSTVIADQVPQGRRDILVLRRFAQPAIRGRLLMGLRQSKTLQNTAAILAFSRLELQENMKANNTLDKNDFTAPTERAVTWTCHTPLLPSTWGNHPGIKVFLTYYCCPCSCHTEVSLLLCWEHQSVVPPHCSQKKKAAACLFWGISPTDCVLSAKWSTGCVQGTTFELGRLLSFQTAGITLLFITAALVITWGNGTSN